MRLRWYGQSAFLLSGERAVFVDPFGDMSQLGSRRARWDYPPIADARADLLLVTHEHRDHNDVDAVEAPELIRSRAGTHSSEAVGQVVGVASEHDPAAGTQRGANVMYRWTQDGLRVAHLGDLGQDALRPEQVAALGEVDVLFVPAGNGPTIGGETAAVVVRALRPRLVVPMHYRTDAIDFLEPPDAFLAALGARVEETAVEVDLEEHLGTPDAPTALRMETPAS